MTSDLAASLATFAGGCVWLGLQPTAESAVAAGVATAILGERVVARMVGPQSEFALQRIRKKVAAGLEQWASAERVEIKGEIAQADSTLKVALQTCIVDHAKIASAAFGSTPFVEGAALIVIEALEAVDPIFVAGATDNVARNYALSVIRIALKAAYSERSYFESLEPHLILEMAHRIGGIAEAQAEHGRKLSDVLAHLQNLGTQRGLSEVQVLGLLKAFEAEGVPVDQAESLLLRKAEEFSALKESLQTSGLDQTGLGEGLRAVVSAIDRGELGQAESILDGLLGESGRSLGESIRAVVVVFSLRGHLANLRSKYAEAAAYFQRGALIAETVDREQAHSLWNHHAQSLSDHSRLQPGVGNLEGLLVATLAAMQLAKPGTPKEVEAKAASIGALGRLAERQDRASAVKTLTSALDLGQETIVSARAMIESPESFVGLANNLGSVIVHAAKLGIAHTLATAESAIQLLQEVRPICREIESRDLPNVLTHLANALRLKRDKLSIQQAIAERQIAIDLYKAQADAWSLANAYNSLGNDYQALMCLNEVRLDQVALASALRAYRQALFAYRKGNWQADWARTQFNIGQTYHHAADRCADDSKLYRLAERRLQSALSVFNRESSSDSWAQCSILLASIRVEILRDQDAEAERLEIAEALLFPVAKAATDWSENQLAASLNVLFALWARPLGVEFRCRYPDLMSRVTAFYQEGANVHQYTPLYPYFEMWRAQADFSIAVMRDDLVAAIEASKRVNEAATFLKSIAPDDEQSDQASEVEESIRVALAILEVRRGAS